MTISEHLTTFGGRPVRNWDPDDGPIDPAVFYRVNLDYDAAESGEKWTDRFAALLDHPNAAVLEGIIVGTWGNMFEDEAEAGDVVEALVVARDRLPELRAIFFGDITYEECEISWIQNTDVSPLFDAYPALEHFAVRGANGLRIGVPRHTKLRSFAIQCGGLDAELTGAVTSAEFPALEHLELWIGTEGYGRTTELGDLAPILAGGLFPKLTYLGLRDAEIADDIAVAVATAPVLSQLQVLDLSLGTLGDTGAEALLASPGVAKLRKLDIHHHYCSLEVVARLEGLGIEIDASDQQKADEHNGESYRYVAVGE